LVRKYRSSSFIVFTIVMVSRDQHHDQADLHAENLSTTLQASLSGTIGKIDLTLLAVADEGARQERDGGIDAATLTRCCVATIPPSSSGAAGGMPASSGMA
jgi:hypothetical protein